MAGNSQRQGAIRKSKKGAQVGSGGQAKRALKGKGPTPQAEERKGHPAARRAAAADRRAEKRPQRGGDARGRTARRAQPGRRGAAREGAGDRAVRRGRPRERRAGHRGDPAGRQPRISHCSRSAGASSTGGPTASCTRASRCRCRRYQYRGAARRARRCRGVDHRTAARRARRGDRPAQPRRGDPLGRGVRRARRDPARTALGRRHGDGLAHVGRDGRARPRGAGDQPGARAEGLPAGRPARRRASTPTARRPWTTSRRRPSRIVVVVGSEGRGLSRLVGETCDLTVSIPMSDVGRVAQRLGRRRGDAGRDRPPPAPRPRRVTDRPAE